MITQETPPTKIELTVGQLLRRVSPATRQHRACSPPMTSAEIMRAWDRYTLRIAELGGHPL
jgi:hypothetical protein